MSFDYKPRNKAIETIEVFIHNLNSLKTKHGTENIDVYDSLGNTVAHMRHLKDYEGYDNDELIELTCLSEANEVSIRIIHYSQFDLRITIQNVAKD